MSGGAAGREPARPDDANRRIHPAQNVNRRRTVHDRHHHVGDDRGNFLALPGVNGHRFSAFAGEDAGSPKASEYLLRHLAHSRLRHPPRG